MNSTVIQDNAICTKLSKASLVYAGMFPVLLGALPPSQPYTNHILETPKLWNNPAEADFNAFRLDNTFSVQQTQQCLEVGERQVSHLETGRKV
jgi:hypothetical protein